MVLGCRPLIAEEPRRTAVSVSPSSKHSSQDATVKSSWVEPIPIPADPELEAQIKEIQKALIAIEQQMVRRKDAVEKAEDAAQKARWYDELELLRKERRALEALLNDLIEEAKASERTEIDEALARVRWLEQRQERWYEKEQLIRERQEEQP
jgi:hypothetical protein